MYFIWVIRYTPFLFLKGIIIFLSVYSYYSNSSIRFWDQKDHTEYYRGVEFNTQLLPKIKVEIVVCKIPVDFIIDTVKKIFDSGTIGDGKVFVYDVENVIKIRTEEGGYSASQDNN